MKKKTTIFKIDGIQISLTKFGSYWLSSAKKNSKFITWEGVYKCSVRELPHQSLVHLASCIGIDQGKMLKSYDNHINQGA